MVHFPRNSPGNGKFFPGFRGAQKLEFPGFSTIGEFRGANPSPHVQVHVSCYIQSHYIPYKVINPSFSEPTREDTAAQVAPPTTASATKSSYVPPHLRNAAANSPASNPSAGPRTGPRRQKYAPDINSEVYFPSLSAAMGTDDPNRGQGQANRYSLQTKIICFKVK